MPMVDWPLERLQAYGPAPTRQPDFDRFWTDALAELAQVPLTGKLERLDYPCDHVEVYDLRFASAGGQEVAAWYLAPSHQLRRSERTPALAVYHGYSGSRSRVAEHLHWALQGYAVLAMDCRGQTGDTPDRGVPTGGQFPGRMTQGILNPLHYYYRGVYQDAVRAVEWLRSRAEVDPRRVAVTGVSQGGGLSIVTAGLVGDLAACLPDVPYLCDFGRSLEAHTDGPYREIIEYLKRRPEHCAQALRTLTYFDGLNWADRITCPTLLSVGLLDTICPPSTGFGVYNRLAGPKQLRIYPYNGHEGGGLLHLEEKYRFLREVFA